LLLNPEIIANLLVDTLFVAYGSIAFFVSLQVVFKWDFSRSDEQQYSLAKQTYLVSTITKYILFLKIPLLLFFIYTLDHLSDIINGAMCAVGVIDASSYGLYLILLKILNVYLFAFWILLNEEDYRHSDLPYTKLKSLFFLFLYALLVIEVILEYLYFADIDPNSLVDCCGAIFSNSSKSWISLFLSLPHIYIYTIFYTVAGGMFLSYVAKERLLYSILSALFVPVAILALIGYFGTYIYELPTHHCPFCLMQSDYDYVGYFLYTFLFIATFYGMLVGLKEDERSWRISLLFLMLYVAIVSYYPLHYYIINGKWLY